MRTAPTTEVGAVAYSPENPALWERSYSAKQEVATVRHPRRPGRTGGVSAGVATEQCVVHTGPGTSGDRRVTGAGVPGVGCGCLLQDAYRSRMLTSKRLLLERARAVQGAALDG